MNYLNRPRVIGLGATVIGLATYLTTLCPTVYVGDSGELSTIAYTLSIAHPPGYPLYTLVGWLFSHLPFGGVALLMNFETALFSAVSIFFTFLFLRLILAKFGAFHNDRATSIISALGSLLWGFSNTLWANSVGAEVYTMGCAMISVMLYLFALNIVLKHFKLTVFLAYLFGFSLANHLSAIALAPVFIAMIIINKPRTSLILWAGLAMCLALTIYFYLPIRSANYPIIDWNHPADLRTFIGHISGERYQGYFAQLSFANIALNLKKFYAILNSEFPFALFGLMALPLTIWKVPVLGIPVCLGALFNIGMGSLYEIPDVEPHFLVTTYFSAFGFIMLIAFGSTQLANWQKNARIAGYLSAIILLMALVFEVKNNYPANNEADNHLAEQYATQILNSLPANATYISVGWTSGSPCIYMRYVEGLRRDVNLYDPISMTSALARYVGKEDSAGLISEKQLALTALEKYKGNSFLGKEHLWGGDNPFKYAHLPLQGYGYVYKYGQKTPADISAWSGLDVPKYDPTDRRLNISERVALANINLCWGEDLQSVGMIEEAREKYLTACEYAEHTKETSMANALGIFFRRQGIGDLALREYEFALDAPYLSNAGRADVSVNIGNLYRDRHDYLEAKKSYLEALRLRNGHLEAEYNLAVTEAYINLSEKKHGAAIDNFMAAVKLDPSDPMLYYNIGLIYDTYLSDVNSAINYYNEFLRRAGDKSMLAMSLKNRIAILAEDLPNK